MSPGPEYELDLSASPPSLTFRGRTLPLDDASLAADLARRVAAQPGDAPVVLGAGTGAVLRALAEVRPGPVAVVDAEDPMREAFDLNAAEFPGLDITWISTPDADKAWTELVAWWDGLGAESLLPLASSTWLRVRPRLYSELLRRMKAPARGTAGGVPKGVAARPATRVLLLRFGYFLEREILNGLAALGVEAVCFSPLEEHARDPEDYVRALLDRVRRTRPGVILSVNSLGLEFSGALFAMLKRLGVVFATWFVDSPELFLHGCPAPVEASEEGAPVLFCCDPDYEEKLRPLGFSHIHPLPLAADHTRFDLDTPVSRASGRLGVSFIGSTWVDKLAAVHREFRLPAHVLREYRAAGREFVASTDRTMVGFLARTRPGMWTRCLGEMDAEDQKGVLHLVCWEANRVYRRECVEGILGFRPLVAGDAHWQRVPGVSGNAVLHPPIGYYTPDLLEFYRLARVNFNCSSMQMRRAVNQRVFDIPAAGGFVLSDKRDQLDACFEPGKEAACWTDPDTAPEEIRRWLEDDQARLRLVNAARRRIAAEHTYERRLESMLRILGQY